MLEDESMPSKIGAQLFASLDHAYKLLDGKKRATALTDELVNRHYDHESRIAAGQLMNANAKIMELKLFLNKSRNRYSQVACL